MLGPITDSEDESEGSRSEDESELADGEDSPDSLNGSEDESCKEASSSEEDQGSLSDTYVANARSGSTWSIDADSDLFDKSNLPGLNTSFNITAKEIDANSPGLTDSGENDSSDSDDTDSDGDIDDGTYLVTSVANLRRRQIFGIEASFEDRRKALSENKRRKESEQSRDYPFDKGKASLEEIQEMVKNTLNEDERNIKKRSPRRSVFSEEKWTMGRSNC
jgi:hypothetical protein